MDESNSSLQRQIENLTAIIELWVPVLEEMKTLQRSLEDLPVSLEHLRQQLNAINQDKLQLQKNQPPETQLQKTSQFKKLEPKLQISAASLEAALPQLVVLEKKIKNLIALKERLEALQESVQPTHAPNYAAEFAQVQQLRTGLKKAVSSAEAEGDQLHFSQDRLSLEETTSLPISPAYKERRSLAEARSHRQSRLLRTRCWLWGLVAIASVLTATSLGTAVLLQHLPALRNITQTDFERR